MTLTVWLGTQVEFSDLLSSADIFCKAPSIEADDEKKGEHCAYSQTDGSRTFTCAAHQLIVDALKDPKVARHLVFVRREFDDHYWWQEFHDVVLSAPEEN